VTKIGSGFWGRRWRGNFLHWAITIISILSIK
jgi:hypothetical protein